MSYHFYRLICRRRFQYTVSSLPVQYLCKWIFNTHMFVLSFLFVLDVCLALEGNFCLTQNRIVYCNDLLSPSGVTYSIRNILMSKYMLLVKRVNGLEIMIYKNYLFVSNDWSVNMHSGNKKTYHMGIWPSE